MFYSLKFIIFIALLLMIYYILPQKWRWGVLLAGSYIFYAYKGRVYIVFILFATVLTYAAARKLETIKARKDIERKARTKARKWVVAIIILILGSLLAVFKFKPITDAFSLILPIGMSYYTFQVIGYIVDVYRGVCPAEKNIFKYALFVGYFPGMVQGPINRFDKMRDQFFAEHHLSWEVLRNGAWLFLWGLFKKLVIADRCAVYVNAVMGEQMADYSGSMLLMSVIMFVIQMYGDFSGGIDMAEGISEMFGIQMYQNFRQPFFAQSISEFWRRWHISLGNWIRDYVFYPLAFSKTYRKVSKWIGKYNEHLGESVPGMLVSMITFTIIGLWHEISIVYLVYGLWYGFTVGSEKVIEPVMKKLVELTGTKTDCMSYRMLCRFRTWIIVLIGESLCILPGIGAFGIMIKAIFTNFRYYELFFDLFEQGLTKYDFFIILVCILIWWAVSFLKEKGHSLRKEIAEQNVWFGWILTVGIIAVIAIYGMYGPGYDAAAFIYGGI